MIGDWTQDDLTLLETMLANGATFADITNVLNAQDSGFRFSRNAVIGKARRMKFLSRNAPVPNPPRYRAPKTTISHPRRPNSEPGGVSIIDLEPHHCRWPLSENIKPILDFRYCGNPKCKESESYCAAHLARSLPNRAVSEAAE